MNNLLKYRFVFLKKRYELLRLKINNRFSLTSLNNREKQNDKVVVSITSYPKRINTAYLSIESIFYQSLAPDRVILWLSKKEVCKNDIPKNLKKLKSRGLEIRMVEDNIKSYKKLFYAIKEFGDQLIITCDDDTIYPKFF